MMIARSGKAGGSKMLRAMETQKAKTSLLIMLVFA